MSLAVDETAEDLPVRDVGLRGGLMPVLQDSVRDMRSWRRPQVLKIKDRQRVFRVPREQLEDQCLRLQNENTLLKQHTRSQEQKLRRMSTRLLHLRHARPASAGGRDGELDDIIQALEAQVSTLESQKATLQDKLSLARQHILDLSNKSHYRPRTARGLDGETGTRRAAQTAPPSYGLTSLEDTRGNIERFRASVMEVQQAQVTELEQAAQSLRDTLRDKEREIEETMKELRKQQADGHKLTIRDNVDVIRLQKQLSDKGSALLVSEKKLTALQEVYETQLEEGQRSLRESQGALLQKVEELSEQLKQETQRAFALEGQLNAASVSLQRLEELKERVSDLEGERNLLKRSYDDLLKSTLSTQSHQQKHEKKEREGEGLREEGWKAHMQRLEVMLSTDRDNTEKLDQELARMRKSNEKMEGERERERETTASLREKNAQLEQEVLLHRQTETTLQEKLDTVTKEFDMSVEELSETLLQIKAFRLQQVNRDGMQLLRADGKVEDLSRDLAAIQASHTETVLELQKTRDLLLLQHRLNNDLQTELRTAMERAKREREEYKRRLGEKDKLLKNRARQISAFQAQLKEMAYSPRKYNQAIPQQYTWAGGRQEVVQPMEEDSTFAQLRGGESLLEIHLAGATFTPVGLRLLGKTSAGDRQGIMTFCTYTFLDFETHSTPLISGGQPNYGFTSHYILSAHDLARMAGQGGSVDVELHQALGGVSFVTRGRTRIPLMAAEERRGERVRARTNITGAEGEVIGLLEFCLRLYTPREPEGPPESSALVQHMDNAPAYGDLGWRDPAAEELFDYDGGIPNELEVVLERCVGLSARWPGLLPDAYLTYRLYDLPPHATRMMPCSAEPVFNDATSYPLAVTTDVLEYLKVASLWVYVFDDSEGQIPSTYLAKTPIPLHALAKGRPIRGDYVLRDAAGGTRGMIRVALQWRYPFRTPELLQEHRETIQPQRETERIYDRDVVPQQPIAKPRVKPHPPPIKVQKAEGATYHEAPQRSHEWGLATPLQSPQRKRSQGLRPPGPGRAQDVTAAKRSPDQRHAKPVRSPESDRITVIRSPLSEPSSPRSQGSSRSRRDVKIVGTEEVEDREKEQEDWSELQQDSEILESDESRASSSSSDAIIIPKSPHPLKKREKLKVEILSLSFDPTSLIAMDKSIQRVFVEYRLLGVPMETTETPMSLRKPTDGKEIHYNFTRVIYVDTAESAPLRQYLHTMLEGIDPNQGRLKFTVVSEPMDEEKECVDVGQAYLDLKEMLLSGNDVIERQLKLVSMDEEQEVVGKLKVSLEAARALKGIYKEHHQQTVMKEQETDEEEERKTPQGNKPLQMLDYDDDF